jgi:segregation and condensation protein A
MPDDGAPDGFPRSAAAAARDADAIAAESFRVELEGFEGPLDMLLALARRQKVDLARISVLALAEQYLAFVARAERLRLELAADYLVMAAWLAWLKSRLLLPPPHADDEPSGEEMAARLTFQLERLEAMRDAAARLMARDRLGRDVFARGEAAGLTVERRTERTAGLADLLRAYARISTREAYRPLRVGRDEVLTMEAALERLRGMLGATPDWCELSGFLPEGWTASPTRRGSAVASSFAAALELARQGRVELRQDETFGPLWLRARADAAE